MPPNRHRLARLRLTAARHRRPLGAALAGTAVFVAVGTLRPAPEPSVPLLTAARDLDAGEAPDGDDLTVSRVRPAQRPAGALRSPAELHGRPLAGPVRRGEPLTDARLVGPGLVDAGQGAVALPVRFADAEAVRLLRPGDRIDVLAGPAGDQPGPAVTVAAGAIVLAVPKAVDPGGSGGLAVLSVAAETATRIVGTASGPLMYTIRGTTP